MVDQNQISHENSSIKRLYRSRQDRIIGGVCGGLAEYFDVDPLLVRIPWVLITVFGGFGLLAYIIGWIIIPQNPYQHPETEGAGKKTRDRTALFGSLLVIIGAILLLRQLDLFYYIHFWDIPWQVIWAALLIIFGIFLLVNRNSSTDRYETPQDEAESPGKQFYRVSDNKMIGGVCSGLASYFDIDVTLVRLAWVTLALASVGVGILAYIIMMIIFPEISESRGDER